jgi:hypothetical protein
MPEIGATIGQAEQTIASRKLVRESGQQYEYRSAMALETISDDLTRLRAEITTLRELFAGFAARPR